ncbi:MULTISPECIES: dienelactone hydrolase family protein [Rhodococcus]|uniref:Dienelactone hydrolase family protein n=1 Tax=Rhodococcus oxybenzonivorans TaxID=1990687 RepID=A0AAE4V4R6_9NOCA|nr:MULTISPECIES: dienelactone hydrolase family protein [Rhodococcus]MDV7245200.1 dienelactone hydrolase family protein [Rhodococcus oxybenzonivorans]MDV7268427.1 dienelactone hydrolase family protein [Rhodococcus oxybenzonivorans]MDV7272518.1 dienelactone hydrolase family protein [Rhodococcus oxybenzonivorans]MDV7336225.1 dienelactone hydrolase family protein [Rhodococcus oxybenzonivorans]MDV7342910.1 dienelactone hydrolase family protein [Rhodococcus oxybenzonivorans]
MTPLQRYIAEEIAVDHADGLLTRREALRRLGLIGLGVAAATSLLAACTNDPGTTAASTASSEASPPPGAAGAVATESVTLPGPDGRTLQGAWAPADSPRGAVLVIHENKGLTDHIRSVAGRFAGAGYSALAVDLLSEEGGTASFTDPAQATATLAKVPPERFVADMKAGVDELERRVPNKKTATVGFCFGGGMVWLLLASGEPRLAASVPFYGPLPENANFSGSRAAVLAIYAEHDARVNASRDAAAAALARAALPHEIVTIPGADHAFFNDTGQRYNPAAASDAYDRVLDWFDEYVR